MYLIFFSEIRQLKKKIEKVALSLPLCKKRSLKTKMLGGDVPNFFFYLEKKFRKSAEKMVLLWSDIEKVIRDEQKEEYACICTCKHIEDSVYERDIIDAIRFLRDTGI